MGEGEAVGGQEVSCEATRRQEVTKELQLSQGSDSPTSSDSLLSLSGLSSSSSASKSSHKDSDSGMVLLYLCVEGGGAGVVTGITASVSILMKWVLLKSV